jgi:hypothetical protein
LIKIKLIDGDKRQNMIHLKEYLMNTNSEINRKAKVAKVERKSDIKKRVVDILEKMIVTITKNGDRITKFLEMPVELLFLEKAGFVC